ncbi:MAG: TOBE domain-containing protein [Acetobacteraceae bacterium]
MSDRIAVMCAGRIHHLAPPEEISRRPATAFVLDFIGSVTSLPCRIEARNGTSVTLRWREATITLPSPPRVPVGPDVLLAARPESWRSVADGAGLPGTVPLRSVHGAGFEYRVRLGGAEIRVMTPNDVRVNEGETVRAVVSEGLLLEPDAPSRPEARAA